MAIREDLTKIVTTAENLVTRQETAGPPRVMEILAEIRIVMEILADILEERNTKEHVTGVRNQAIQKIAAITRRTESREQIVAVQATATVPTILPMTYRICSQE